MTPGTLLYDDGKVAGDGDGIPIRWYYPWGSKRILFRHIPSAKAFELRPILGKGRLWGSGDFKHWYNLDVSRRNKDTGIELDLGRFARPCITPDDVEAVMRIVAERVTR